MYDNVIMSIYEEIHILSYIGLSLPDVSSPIIKILAKLHTGMHKYFQYCFSKFTNLIINMVLVINI
jgi:hypothetical protein